MTIKEAIKYVKSLPEAKMKLVYEMFTEDEIDGLVEIAMCDHPKTAIIRAIGETRIRMFKLPKAEAVQFCEWVRAFDNHFNISCVNETHERANGNFKGKDKNAKWEFKYCPYCGKPIKEVFEQN